MRHSVMFIAAVALLPDISYFISVQPLFDRVLLSVRPRSRHISQGKPCQGVLTFVLVFILFICYACLSSQAPFKTLKPPPLFSYGYFYSVLVIS